MTDPKRWTEGGEASELERELLGAGQASRMTDAERRAIWAGIALTLPSVAAPLAAKPLIGAGGVLSTYFSKGVVILAAVGGLTYGAARLLRSEAGALEHAAPVRTAAPAQAAAPASPMAQTPASPETAAASPSIAAPTEPETAALPAGAADAKAKPGPTETQLREESLAVLDARAALRAGQAGHALTLLDQMRARFPHGALGQEREALTIEALAKTGQAAAAGRRADAFVRNHPHSPYVADVKRFASP
jgi:hypothetical protein